MRGLVEQVVGGGRPCRRWILMGCRCVEMGDSLDRYPWRVRAGDNAIHFVSFDARIVVRAHRRGNERDRLARSKCNRAASTRAVVLVHDEPGGGVVAIGIHFRDHPILQSVVLAALYLVLGGNLFLLNSLIAPHVEPRPLFAWPIWAALFAPAILSTVLSAVSVAPDWRRFKTLGLLSLIATLVVAEVAWAMDMGLGGVFICVVVLCGGIIALFRYFGESSPSAD